MLALSEYSRFINTKTHYISDIHPHSFIIKNYSPTIGFGLYHGEEGPPDIGKTGISVNILQHGVGEGLSFFYPQPTLTGLAVMS